MKELFKRFVEAKAREDAAKKQRQEIARLIANEVEHPEEGQRSVNADGYKVTVKGVVNRTVDWEAFDRIWGDGKDPPVKIKRELDTKGLAYYRETDPALYLLLCEVITAKPGAPQVTVEVIGV
jgi:hypothetical protein